MSAVIDWLDDRLGLSTLREVASHKTVPAHRFTVLYYLGGMTLFFFLVQVCTGVLLMLYYRPSAEEAFESVEFIMTTVPFGWLIRSVHSWSANLMVFFAFLHLVTVFFMKAYRAPREMTWISGVLVLLLVMGFGFSGYLLPWNQLAFFATKVGTDVAGVMPLVGPWMVRFLRGGDRVSGATLSRFYGWHVAILPAITFLCLGLHLAMVQLNGMSVPPGAEDEAKSRTPMKFFPHFALRDLTGWVIALGCVAAIAALFPWDLGDKADLFAPAYENIRPEWYFIFMFQTLKLVPGGAIFGIEYEAIPIALFGLGAALLMAVPFLDRKNSRWLTPIGVLVLAFIVGMTCWGYGTIIPLLIVAFSASILVLLGWFTRPSKTLLMIAMVFLAMHARAETCTDCHKDISIAKDVHASAGLSCHDCHGELHRKPTRAEIPDFCGKCHGDAAYMKRFNPATRIDQVTEYWTSRHGQLLKQGDKQVAVCIDCHSHHDIRRKSQQDSPVYKTHVAETCSRCHSDEYGRWKVSVHAKAVLEKGDIAAPTCNDCHGNHGAMPPGVESISFVCGRCHAREAELFRKSPKHEGWAKHNEMMNGMACAACHADGVRAKVTVTQFSECVTCHENHGIVRPTIALLGTLPDTPCAFCHEGVGPLAARIAEMPAKAEHFRQVRNGFLEVAKSRHLQGNDRFDWLVDQARNLPFHHAGAEKEFVRLFDKFRIGKTHYTYRDVATGKEITVPVRSCPDCHEESDSAGLANARAYLRSTRGLTSMIGRADRILLSAHRGGVEVRKVRAELDGAIDSQIELESLVHTFGTTETANKQKEGLQHAEAALVAGQSSLEELAYRRRGLLVALGIIVLVLAALVLKIRQL